MTHAVMTATRRSNSVRQSPVFWLSFVAMWWLAHVLIFFMHEFGHAFTAWIAGYKSNPLALNYGHLSLANLLLQVEIDENVDYGPIFAAGKGYLAALIAAAGVLVNVILYFATRRLFSLCRSRGQQRLGLFAFLLCLMNVGNFLDYVPARTFATHGDMATVERGLQISPWWIVIVAGIPFALAIWHFFRKLLPEARGFLFPGERVRQIALVAASSFMMFVFFGPSGIHGYGPVSHWISVFSLVLFPASLVLCWPRGT